MSNKLEAAMHDSWIVFRVNREMRKVPRGTRMTADQVRQIAKAPDTHDVWFLRPMETRDVKLAEGHALADFDGYTFTTAPTHIFSS